MIAIRYPLVPRRTRPGAPDSRGRRRARRAAPGPGRAIRRVRPGRAGGEDGRGAAPRRRLPAASRRDLPPAHRPRRQPPRRRRDPRPRRSPRRPAARARLAAREALTLVSSGFSFEGGVFLGSGRGKPTSRRPSRPGARTSRSAEPPPAPSPEGAPEPVAGEPDEVQHRPPGSDFPIVGVGASAGGLDAFRQLLGALPTDTGMAFVLVQHLDPSHESMLADLLAKGSRLPVSEVRGDTAVEPDHVYVTPGRSDVALEGDVLKLVPRVTTGGRHLPIDSFLRTLAEARGSKAVGVILSGTGSDGTLGARAIKAEGGIVFAQDLESAPHDGMPRSAIASGCVDFVLPPQRIAQELSRLSRHPYVITPPRQERAGRAAALVAEGEGRLPARSWPCFAGRPASDFSAYKPPTIKRRIARRMALANVETLEEYAAYLEGHADEVQALHQECLITVTSFFRDPGTFEVLSPRGPAPAAEGSAARRAGAGVGARVRHRRGGLLDRHLPAGSRGRAGDESLLPGLRHRPLRERRGEGAIGTVPAAHRPGRLAGTPAAVLHRGGRRLPGDQDHPRHVRLRTARRDPGPAVQPHGPDQLPKRAHLPRASDAAEGHGRLPLRPPDLGRPAPGDVGDGEHGREPLHARGQEAPDLPQAARRRPGPLRSRRLPGRAVERCRRAGRSRRSPAPARSCPGKRTGFSSPGTHPPA